jgi:7,8-dihydropterin-6-yl-methyl-4-(beta-D-ribofuranosyl)aminobenzene 5'-phosphate synthase
MRNLFLIFLAFSLMGVKPIPKEKKLSFIVLYNNVPHDKELTTAWGFSCLVKGTDKNILFDTGGDGKILLSNMKKLKIDPKEIDFVVLSHIHGDHTGGLWELLRVNNKIVVYLPESFPKDFKDRARKQGAEVVSVQNPIGICKNVYLTGELGTRMKEQSLVIDTPRGLIIITGCAHPGIVNIVRKAKKSLNNKLYLVLGGFHLIAYTEKEVKKIIKDLKELGVVKVGPSHCTGGRPIELFREAWGKNFFDMGCGATIELNITESKIEQK